MSDNCNHDCDNCGQECAEKPVDFSVPLNEYSKVKKVIGVVSGKGGVGKSLVTSMLAILSKRKDKNVAILDADITGPSIPKVFGLKEKAKAMNEKAILPVATKTGIEVMSINLLLEDDASPVIWRGPVLAGTVKQFWSDVVWNDVDYMYVDMPPGTGDVPLTVFQSIPISGIVIVTSPQELVSLIVEKAVNMAKMMNVPIIGIVENMSYFECPTCKERHEIYGKSHIEEIAKKHGIEKVAKIPMKTEIAALCDKGLLELFEGNYLDEMEEKIENL